MQLAVTNDAMIRLISDGNAYVLWQTLSNELSTPKILVCPEDKQRTEAGSFTQNFSDANISYFISLDASDANPQMIFSGDDNFSVNGIRVRPGILNLWTNASVAWTKERHGGAGNIALSDGSVQTDDPGFAIRAREHRRCHQSSRDSLTMHRSRHHRDKEEEPVLPVAGHGRAAVSQEAKGHHQMGVSAASD